MRDGHGLAVKVVGSRGRKELGGRFGYFLFFSAREGESEAPGGGEIFIENPRGEGGLPAGGGPGGCLRGMWGGGS